MLVFYHDSVFVSWFLLGSSCAVYHLNCHSVGRWYDFLNLERTSVIVPASKCVYLRKGTSEVMSLLSPFSNASLLPSCAVSSISNGRYTSEQDVHTIALLRMNDRRRRKKPSQNTLRSPCLKGWVFPKRAAAASCLRDSMSYKSSFKALPTRLDSAQICLSSG